MKKPQIVAPGGSEKAIIALDFGADSVYVASKNSAYKNQPTT